MKRFPTQMNYVSTGGLLVLLSIISLGYPRAISAQDSSKDKLQCSVKNGSGICTYPDTKRGETYDYYRGEIRGGIPNGQGTFVYKNDSRYEGQVRNGQPNGKGMFLFANNDRYEGNFLNGEFSGSGKFVFTNGDRYTGQVRKGQPDGKGTLLFNGKTFTGEFRLGQINGSGVLTTDTGARCQGVFYSNLLSGKGNCSYPSGGSYKSYSGEMRNGLPEGRGTVVFSNGKRFSGEFRGGTPVLATTNK